MLFKLIFGRGARSDRQTLTQTHAYAYTGNIQLQQEFKLKTTEINSNRKLVAFCQKKINKENQIRLLI